MKDAAIQRWLSNHTPPADHPDPDLWLLQQAAWWVSEWDRYGVKVVDNPYASPEWDDDTWEEAIEIGHSYMVGDNMTRAEYLRRHSSNLTLWQKMAYAWCKANPTKRLVVANMRFWYHVSDRKEYVEIGLPYHDQGGERHWATRDGKRKVLINVD